MLPSKNIKIYIRSTEKVYIYYENEIQVFENEKIEHIIENFFDDNNIENIEVSLIFHFSYFLYSKINDNENDNKLDIKNIFKKYNYIKEKFYFNHIENEYMDIFLKKDIINEWKIYLKKYKSTIKSAKIDFDCIYNVFKNENCELLQLGEEKSIRMKIENRKINDFEIVDLKIYDIEKIEEFDFGDIVVIECEKEDLEKIFYGEELFKSPNFMIEKYSLKKIFMDNFSSEEVKNLKKISILDTVLLTTIMAIFLGSYYFIPVNKEKTLNSELQQQLKENEDKYLKTKSEKIEDFSQELSLLTEIDESMKRKEFYSLIKVLIDNSSLGVDYTQIKYENKKWSIQGEINNFEKFEEFENNLLKKYTKTELGYIKNNDIATIFEYNIFE